MEEFPTPDGAVGAVAGAVEGEAESGGGEAIFGEAGGDVGVVVLDADEGQVAGAGVVLGPGGGEVLGMEVVGDGLGGELKGGLEVGEGVLEEFEGGALLEVAEVLALVGVGASGEGEDGLHLAADGEQRRRVEGQGDGKRDVAAGAADELGLAGDDGGDGVVSALEDFAIVEEEAVGDAVEAGAGFVVVDTDGLVGEVGAGHDEGGEAAVGKEQVVERRVGEEKAEPRDAGGDGWGDGIGCRAAGVSCAAEEDDGALDGGEDVDFLRAELAEGAGGCEVANHDGEGLAGAVLSLAEAVNGSLIGGVDGEVEAADAFDGEDLSVGEAADGFLNGVLIEDGAGWVGGDEFDLGAADGAGVGLGMEAAVGRVVVFLPAGGTHGEDGHGGLGAVVGDAAGDGEAGAAVGAVEEGIAEAAVGGVEELAEAVGTGGCVSGDACAGVAGVFAEVDGEAGFAGGGEFGFFDGVDAGEGGLFGAEAVEEAGDLGGGAFDFGEDALGVIGDPAGEGFFLGEAVEKGAVADALDDAADADGAAVEGRDGGGGHGAVWVCFCCPRRLKPG